jgi:hypothetical protein
LGPSTVTVFPSTLYLTPAGSGIGFFPIRDILQILCWLASPDEISHRSTAAVKQLLAASS